MEEFIAKNDIVNIGSIVIARSIGIYYNNILQNLDFTWETSNSRRE